MEYTTDEQKKKKREHNTHEKRRIFNSWQQNCVENEWKRCSKRLSSVFHFGVRSFSNFNILKMKYKNKKHVSETQIAARIQWTCVALYQIGWAATTTYIGWWEEPERVLIFVDILWKRWFVLCFFHTHTAFFRSVEASSVFNPFAI